MENSSGYSICRYCGLGHFRRFTKDCQGHCKTRPSNGTPLFLYGCFYFNQQLHFSTQRIIGHFHRSL